MSILSTKASFLIFSDRVSKMSDNIFTSIFKIIWAVAILNFVFLVSLPFVAEYISGDEILSDSIGPSKNIEANIMLTENEKVTIVFKTEERSMNPELLKISLIDPQNREFFWEKSFVASNKPETQNEPGTQQTIDFFSFTPEASGIHHIKINNADFQTEVKIVSGMISPTEQPSYFPVLLMSLMVTFAGFFLFRDTRIGLRGFSFSGLLNFFIALSLSLIIVYKIIGL